MDGCQWIKVLCYEIGTGSTTCAGIDPVDKICCTSGIYLVSKCERVHTSANSLLSIGYIFAGRTVTQSCVVVPVRSFIISGLPVIRPQKLRSRFTRAIEHPPARLSSGFGFLKSFT